MSNHQHHNHTAESIALAVHITVFDQLQSHVDKLADIVREILWHKYKIDHPILQFESTSCAEAQLLCCNLKQTHKHS